ncbi:MAG: hypothetical protein WA771_02935 [Chthoniobacterales bacterium]
MRFLLISVPLILLIQFAACTNQTSTAPTDRAPLDLWESRPTDSKTFLNPAAALALAESTDFVTHPTSDEMAALQDPGAWRRLDRRHRYDAVLLAGQPAETATLARHLAVSPDFRLERVDNWGFLFLRGLPSPVTPPPAKDIAADLPHPEDRAALIAATAVNLDIIGEFSAARELLAAARELAPEAPAVLVCAATIDLQHERYSSAVSSASQALDLTPESIPALQIAAQSFAAVGAHDQAWRVAERLIDVAPPNDIQTLFLHAQLASNARAFSREQESLERLIEITEDAGRSATSYHVYLGQSFARQGLPRPAVKHFEAALADPDLDSSQRTDLEGTVKNIRDKTGI